MKRIAAFLAALFDSLRRPTLPPFAVQHAAFLQRAKAAQKRHIRIHGGRPTQACALCVSFAIVNIGLDTIGTNHIAAVEREVAA